MEQKVDRIVAFDFDDTLAETGSLIGARFAAGDNSFEDFILDNNIHFVEFNEGFWWVDSANYALLEDLSHLVRVFQHALKLKILPASRNHSASGMIAVHY